MLTVSSTHNDAMRSALGACATGIKWAALFAFFINALQLVVPLYMLQVYDRIIISHSVDTLVMLTVLALACLLFLASLDFVRTRVFIAVGDSVARKLNVPTLQAAVTRSLGAAATQSSQPMRDLHELRQFVTSGPIGLPLDALYSPFFLGLLFVMHPAYGAVAAGAMLILLSLSVMSEYFFRRPLAKANDAALRSHAEVGAAIRSSEIIEAMGMLGAVARRWDRGQKETQRQLGDGHAAMRAIVIISRSVRMAVQIVMLGIGAYLVIQSEASPGSIVASTIMMARALFPFEQLIEGWRHWSQAISAYRRLDALLHESRAVRQAMPLTVNEARIAVDRVGFVPPASDRAVLKGVSFDLEPGEVLKISGPSGAGKSTLARLLVGVLAPTTGGVYLDGHNVFTWERESFGRGLGYLPQFSNLLDGTVGENISRLLDATPQEIVAAARRVGAHETIGRLPYGYDTPVGEGGFNLSGGQRQRIALARAFFRNPKLVVLDEPSNHLDADGMRDLEAAIAAAAAEGATIIVISHQSNVAEAADKLLILRDGAVEAFGRRDTAVAARDASEARVARKGGQLARLHVGGFAS
jgi:ATP-binding cassette subfamily C protein